MNSWLPTALLLLGQDEEVGPAAPQARVAWLALAAVFLLLAAWNPRRWRGVTRIRLLLAGLVAAAFGAPTAIQTQIDQTGEALWAQIGGIVGSPLCWAVVLTSLGLLLLLPRSSHAQRVQGAALVLISLGFYAAAVPSLAGAVDQAVFWILAAVTLVSAVATISMRNPVYSAIWFSLSLLGTAGLFFYQGSLFLGVATVAVYAGAIVVTLLFVVMLAQPEGHATCDRLSWGAASKPVSVVAGAVLVGAMAFATAAPDASDRRSEIALLLSEVDVVYSSPRDGSEAKGGEAEGGEAEGGEADDGEAEWLLTEDQLAAARVDGAVLRVTVRGDFDEAAQADIAQQLTDQLSELVVVERLDEQRDVLHPSHMARMGAVLFGQHLLSVEIAGTLLLTALVGAIAIAIQGKDMMLLEGPD